MASRHAAATFDSRYGPVEVFSSWTEAAGGTDPASADFFGLEVGPASNAPTPTNIANATTSTMTMVRVEIPEFGGGRLGPAGGTGGSPEAG
jgi:hypothetical protein